LLWQDWIYLFDFKAKNLSSVGELQFGLCQFDQGRNAVAGTSSSLSRFSILLRHPVLDTGSSSLSGFLSLIKSGMMFLRRNECGKDSHRMRCRLDVSLQWPGACGKTSFGLENRPAAWPSAMFFVCSTFGSTFSTPSTCSTFFCNLEHRTYNLFILQAWGSGGWL